MCFLQLREFRPGVSVGIDVSGQLDLVRTPEFEEMLAAYVGYERVVLNLARCSFIDSTALGVLVRHHLAIAEAGGTLTLTAVPAAVEQAIAAGGLAELLGLGPADGPHPTRALDSDA